MQFSRNAILTFSVTACAIVYLTGKSSNKLQQQNNDRVLEHVFALHTKAIEESIDNDSGISQRSDSDNKDSNSDSRNLFSIIPLMGGELPVEEARMGPWDHFNAMMMYSSTPLNPRQYAGEDTEFLHYKDPQEQDEGGTTTFPPTRTPTKKPLQQNSGGSTENPTPLPTKFPTQLPVTLEPTEFGGTRHPTKLPTRLPTKLPTRMPSKIPTREPTKEPSRHPTPNPSRFPTKFPTREPTRDPTREPTRDPSRQPSRNPTRLPTRLPTREPTKEPTKEPTREPTRDPSGGPTRLPTRLPTRMPTKIPTREPTKEPTKDPSRHPTSPPIQQYSEVATPNPTKEPTSGTFYCGWSVEDASSCKHPCPGGISDCASGFCYAVSQCIEQVDAAVTPGPTRSPTSQTTQATPQPTEKPTTDDFFCGNSLMDASSACEFSCPSGSPTECPDNLTCYASTGCLEEASPSPTRSPSYDPSGSFYCGSSFQEASQQCLDPCPSGLSSDCPVGQACYANTPCSDKDGFFCGTSIVDASASCEHPCANGLDSECPTGLSCYETQTCKTWGQTQPPTRAPMEPAVDDGTKYCGYSYEHAATQCTQPCESGLSDGCPEGMSCYSHTPCEEKNTFYCGISWNNAASSCRYPCPSGTDSECPSGTQCYAYTTCDETDSFMCGTSFDDASSNCDEPCPSGSPTECPSGESCFTHTTCKSSESIQDVPTAAPVEPYIPGDSYFCGTSYLEASSQCTHPCPTRLDSECPNGEQCYGSTPCPSRDTYYCGANLDEASAICDYPCPTGSSGDCPTGLSCFAFTTCADKDSFYCGNNYIEASGTCETPCPSGLSSDCPDGLTCFAHTTCAIEETEEPEPSGPTESYFCGFTFDEATSDCSLPCPSGTSDSCPSGMTCFPNTSCADRDSFMCGYTWESASATCSNPCPSGEHSDCPDGMSCFAYTPCNNDGSYYCGTSFDEASDCQLPCPSGEASECPNGLSCFSYTTCGTGDFNTKAPTDAPTPVNYVPPDSFYCGTSFDDASSSCEFKCPNGSTDCPTGLACYEYTTCVGGPSPSLSPTGEHDSFYCGTNYADANEKCLVPCPNGNSNECPTGESCIPFTSCNEQETAPTPASVISTTFYCGLDKTDAEGSCNYPCPGGTEECPDGMSCYSFTSCVDLPENEPTPIVSNTEPSPSSGSLYCGSSFEDATSKCLVPCPGGTSAECPTGQSCYGYTACDDHDTFYCGTTWDEAAATCSKPCPSGSNDECDNGEICFGYTPCGGTDVDIPVDSFYCGATFEEASLTCSQPCPSSKHSECPDGQMCHPYTPCGERDSMYCGTSWTDAATSCLLPCPSGSSSDCPTGQFCFPSTPCDETGSFFCGSSFDEATSTCGVPCPTGKSSTCPNGQGCFAYTLCNEDGSNAVPTPTLAPNPIVPPDSYFCGTSFDDASSSCMHPCPSGLTSECPNGLLCFASTSCSDKGSFFCGATWEEAASTCALPCESGLSSDCPDGQKCFGYTPCSKSDSFYCGTSFDEASSTCTDPCPSGLDAECPGSETCHKYTPCSDITPSSIEDIPDDSFYCGVNFIDASDRCHLPCPSGSAAECPVGEACYGNTPCTGGDSFFCGTTWYDAASECKIPCPSGLDKDCPADSKCFGYTPCSDTNSYYCGIDFYDASTNCIKPCPTGSSSECPEGFACFPNTPCDSNEDSTPKPTAKITSNPTSNPTSLPTKVPTSAPTASIQQMSATISPHVSMFLYCGIDIENVNCLLPCPNGNECPLGHECYATTECSESFFCGQSFADANNTCAQACPDGLDTSCPESEFCFAQTSCADTIDVPDNNIVDVGSFYCGKNHTDASTSCALACPSGSSSECAELGPEYSCYANTPCDDSDTYFCGTTWNHAASNCLFPCRSGLDSECPHGTFCFPYTTCNDNDSFMCGTSFEDAASCLNPCPSGSSSECPFGQSCFTHTTCSSASEPEPETDSFFCGSSFEDASASCSIPCASGRSDQCPDGQWCFAYTLCNEEVPTSPPDSYFCGTSFDDASSSCTHPCPSGLSNECPNGLLCFASTSCNDKGSFFCGTTWEEAASTCALPCESGLSSDCPVGQKCYGYTPCMREDTFYCGTSFDEASSTCTDPCPSGLDAECPGSETCHKYTPCADGIPEFSTVPTSAPDDSYYCGKSFDDAGKCVTPCPSGSAAECPVGESCFAHTTCSMLQPETFFCGSSFNDASSSAVPCEDGVCPDGRSCYAYTPCAGDIAAFSEPITEPEAEVAFSPIPVESYYCGLSYMDASGKCTKPCPSRDSNECPGAENCYAYTPCAQPESFFCGSSLEDANESCTVPCPTGRSDSCPTGESCFAYTTCTSDMSSFSEPAVTPPPTTKRPTVRPTVKPSAFPTKYPTKVPTKKPTPVPTKQPSNKPTSLPTLKPTPNPTRLPTKNPTKFPTKVPTKYPTKNPTANPTKAPIVPVIFDVPKESFYCGANFEHATQMCGVPCPNGPSDCPLGLKCFGNTPCADRMSFFCGTSYEDANAKCSKPCPSGSAEECDGQQSCFAYTMCRHVTATPTEEPTFKPSLNPTKKPTPRPTFNPTKYPTHKPTREPSPPPTVKATPPPTVKETPPPTVKETPPPTEKEPAETPDEEQPSEMSAETPDEEQPSEMSEAVVIELKPCDDPLAMTVNQAYWRSWSSDRPETCNRFEASDIDDETYTHLVYSFASISAAGHVEPWAGSWDEVEKYKEFNKVKERNPSIKTIIAVTEGIFYGGGMNPVSFTEIAETEASRMAFAQSAVSFLDMYNFDGIDLDWEAPLDRDRGGSPDNYERFVQVAKEIRLAFDESGKDYLLTIALPGTDWEQLDYDIVALSEYVDWFNLNTFDYHTPKNIPKTVGSHSDLKMIDAVVYELLQETISTKFVLGMAAFGRTYTLADERCKELNCPFRSPGLGGCGNTPGFLPFAEISEYIDSNSYDELHHDVSSSSMVAVVDSDQMISFDNEETWAIKEAYAEMMCLRGTMLWSIDMFKAPSTPARSQTRDRALLEREARDSCSLCGGLKLFSGATIEYDGDTVSCANVDDMLTSSFVPQESDHCTEITSKYQESCCAKAPTTPCNICGSDHVFGDTLVRYAGMDTTCRDISESFLQFTDEHSFSCSLAKSLIPRTCCVDSPVVDITQVEVEASIAATDDEPQPCNICQQGGLHHALKAETMVEYKGASISCLDVNSILAKNENIGSDMCDATQSLLFKGCCYEKCSLCGGEETLNVDATVKHNGRVLSCDEMSSIFTLSVTEKGSEQCDAMQTAYASTCCYKPPERPCHLCKRGTTSYEVNTSAFVKTHTSSSSFCVDVLNELAMREEEGSDTCMHSKTAYFSKCCDILSLSTDLTIEASLAAEPKQDEPKQNEPHGWLTDHFVAQTQSSAFFPSTVWALFSATLVGVVAMLF